MQGSWTFARKMALVFGIVVVLAAALVAVSALSLDRVIRTNETLLDGDVANLIEAERLRSIALEKSYEVRGYLLTGDESFIAAAERADVAFDDAIRALRGRAAPGEVQLVADIERAMVAYRNAIAPLVARRREADGLAAVIGTFRDQLAPGFAVLNDRIVDYVDDQSADLAATTAGAREEAQAAQHALIGVGGAAILAALVLAVLLTRAVTRQIGSSVQHVRSSSTELQAAATQQASGAKEQATAMSEISMTITELLTTSRQIASSAQQVATVAEQTADGAAAGRGAIHDAERAMATIKQQVENIAQRMLEVGKKSQQIGGILSIINELSEQTNILAINATIEAASAGEAGKRFAVVGDEVRKLAERVGGSSKQVRTLIEEMREAVNATVMVTETHSKAVESGAQTFSRLTTVFDGIAGAVDTTKDVAREIELSTKQQTTAVEQVNVAIADAAQATREAETGSSQTLQTASQLADLSDQLMRIIQSAAPMRA